MVGISAHADITGCGALRWNQTLLRSLGSRVVSLVGEHWFAQANAVC